MISQLFPQIKSFTRSGIVKNSITLLSASSLSQVIAIIVYPIVTRQYNPNELGVLSLFLSIVGIGSILASGKYEAAVMVEKEKKTAAAAFDLSFLINIGVSLVFLVAFVFFKSFIIKVFHIESVAEYVNYIPLLIFLSSLGLVFTYWFNRINRFNVSARYNIVQSAANSSLKVGFGTLGLTQWGLIAASVLGQLIGVISVFIRKSDYSSLFKFEKKTMKEVAIRQANFPKFMLPHTFINTLSGNLPIMILAAYFNMTEVGLFSLGITMGFKPITLFAGSVNQVFFQKVSQNKAEGINSYLLLKNFCVKTLLIGAPAFLILYFSIPELVKFLFGSTWIKAGEYLQLMLPWFLIALMSSSICFMPAVAQKQLKAMVLEIVYAILRISALFIGVWQQNIKLAILLFSFVNTIYISGLLIWYLRLAKNDNL